MNNIHVSELTPDFHVWGGHRYWRKWLWMSGSSLHHLQEAPMGKTPRKVPNHEVCVEHRSLRWLLVDSNMRNDVSLFFIQEAPDLLKLLDLHHSEILPYQMSTLQARPNFQVYTKKTRIRWSLKSNVGVCSGWVTSDEEKGGRETR